MYIYVSRVNDPLAAPGVVGQKQVIHLYITLGISNGT